MILQGGAFNSGSSTAFRAAGNVWFTQSPGGDTVARYSPWFRLQRDPLGRDFSLARAWVSHRDYELAPIRASKGSELKQDDDIAQWGVTYTYYWRHIIDPNWITWPGEDNSIIGQLHEVNGPAGVHRPTFEFHISESEIRFTHTIDAYTLGLDVHSMALPVGQEVETFIRARWADGVHVADADGILELWVNGVLVWQINGQRNTWEPNPDDHPCYMVGGIYVPESTLSWWTGRERLVYMVGMAVGDEAETASSMRAHVDAGINQ